MIDPWIYKISAVFALLILWDYLTLWFFQKKIVSTYTKIVIDKNKVSRFAYSTDLLLQKYKLVPRKNLNLIKLELESIEFSNSWLTQMFDSFHKLILTVTISAVTVATTISVAMLAFLKDNNSTKIDQVTFVEEIRKNFSNFTNSLSMFINLIVIGLIIFVVFTSHSHVVDAKNKLKVKHLRFIEEALKDD
ncbi:hypothetical protein MHH60_23125 [Paenibacillus sp. FSL H7-0716]|uniref:MotA/TolQ/ExbB proton channel domain-containing protein n=1 Tax=Paenibacillus odorifer TaxID=189426 RepID=A0AB36J8Q4_9BACL|nr:hypothetical protein [Paenibacillus odorifer]OME09823.1 hypothetical protein BSK47_31745 [Paenibacillus odorifer]